MNKLYISTSPHLKKKDTTTAAMRDVVIALVPAALTSIIFFGLNALVLIVLAILAALATDAGVRKILGHPPTIGNWSAALTGLLFALTLPPIAPWWIAIAGSFFAIAIAKELTGGLGHNIFNPALAGRAFVTVSWAALISLPLVPFWWKITGFFDFAYPKLVENKLVVFTLQSGRLDDITSATPLAMVREKFAPVTPEPASYLDLLLGNVGGSLGETSTIALLLGALFLFYKGHIKLRIPLSFVLTVMALSGVLGRDPLYDLLSGGLILGAFFMATDWVTTPVTPKGEIIFGIGAGVLTALIRSYGGYPEGVLFAILLMNAATPVIDKYMLQKQFGGT